VTIFSRTVSRGDNVVLLNLETYRGTVLIFGSVRRTAGRVYPALKHRKIEPPKPWVWDSVHGALGLQRKQIKRENLTAEKWVRSLCTDLDDHRLDEPDMDQLYKKKYGPKKGI